MKSINIKKIKNSMLIGFIIYLIFPTTAFSQWNCRWHFGNWHHWWMGNIIMWIIILIFIGLIIYLIIQKTKSMKTGDAGQSPQESALDILKKRYAKGEITKEQFIQMKNDLET